MPFNSTDSLNSTNTNNMLRGLVRDNADHSVTGTAVETTLGSTTITANTIGATGLLHIIAAGSSSGTAGSKTIRVYFGSQIAGNLTVGTTPANNWLVELWLANTASNAQRLAFKMQSFDGSSAAIVTNIGGYNTYAIDTTANQTLSISGQLGNTADTLKQNLFDVFVCQIT